MAQVKLTNFWFSPEGKRYKAGVHYVDDSLLDHLPPSAVVISVQEPEAEPEPQPEPELVLPQEPVAEPPEPEPTPAKSKVKLNEL